MTLRILLADDHEIVLEGLSALIEKEAGMEVVGTARDGREAVRQARELSPDVVLMDLAMPGLSGIEATRQIVAELPAVKVLCLSMHAERRYVSAVIEAGAAGYLLKDCALEELAQAVRQVSAGRSYLSPAVAATVIDDYAAHLGGHADADASPLSAREREVLQLLAEGRQTREIAELLHLSVKTVGSHRDRIKKKLGIDVELVEVGDQGGQLRVLPVEGPAHQRPDVAVEILQQESVEEEAADQTGGAGDQG